MKKIHFSIIFLVLAFGVFFASEAVAQTVELSPASLQAQKNQSVALTVSVKNVSNLFGVAFDLDYNPSLLDFVSATEGSFLNQGCQTSLMTAENPPGKIIYGHSRLTNECGGVSGQGTLATFNFVSLSAGGTTNLSFSNTGLCIVSGQTCNYNTPGSWIGGSVTVAGGTSLSADFNNDSRVNSVDFGIMMSNWGSMSRPPSDINQDGAVNSVDFGILMSQWTG